MASRKPFGFKQSSNYTEVEVDSYDPSGDTLRRQLKRTKLYVRAAEIVQSIASVVTIPITSAVCSVAAVAFMQAGALRTRLTLRQTAALADQGWASVWVYKNLSKLGSLPLYIAMGITILGMCINRDQILLQHTSYY